MEDSMNELVRQLFEILNHTEENDDGVEFHTTCFSCKRIEQQFKLSKVLIEMNKLLEGSYDAK
jgi:hypothetical protein